MTNSSLIQKFRQAACELPIDGMSIKFLVLADIENIIRQHEAEQLTKSPEPVSKDAVSNESDGLIQSIMADITEDAMPAEEFAPRIQVMGLRYIEATLRRHIVAGNKRVCNEILDNMDAVERLQSMEGQDPKTDKNLESFKKLLKNILKNIQLQKN